MNENPDNTGDYRGEDGRFVPGHSGNPDGKPKGSISIIAKLKSKLSETPPGQKKTYLELLVDRMLKVAIVDGDPQMIKQIWNYVDGMPKQSIQYQEEIKPVLVQFVDGNTNNLEPTKN